VNSFAGRVAVFGLALWTTAAYAANPVYFGANYGLYKSTDAGATWTQIDIPLNNPLLSQPINVIRMAKDPHDSNKIYFTAQAKARAFFATTDGGRTWLATPFVGMSGQNVAVDFAGQVVYIDASQAGGLSDNILYKTTDRGANWTRVPIPNTTNFPASSHPYGAPVQYFAVDPFVSGTVYVYSQANTLLKSTDFGQTWTQVANAITLSSTGKSLGGVQNLNLDPWNPQTWYDTVDFSRNPPGTCPLTNGGLCGLFKSTDGGATFSGLSIQTNYVTSVAFSGVS